MDVLERLSMPECEHVKVPVKTLEEQLDASNKEKHILENHISSMNLVSLINERTIRIRAYKDEDYSFQTIYVFDILLKTDLQLTDFTELLHSAFPESTLFIMRYNDKVYLSGAGKRINKNDSNKSVIEDDIWIEFSDEMKINIESTPNLKEYYEQLLKELYRLKVLNVTGIYPTNDGDYKAYIKQFEQLSSQISKLKDDYKEASMMSEQMRIDEELFQKEEHLEALKKEMAGGK